MPYIASERRLPYNRAVAELIAKIRAQPMEKQDGDINYVISAILVGNLTEDRYFNYSRAHGILSVADKALWDTRTGPHEKEARKHNGPIDIEEIMKTLEETT